MVLNIYGFLKYNPRIRTQNNENNENNENPLVSVIVAARNEEKNIERLLESLVNQTHSGSNYEVIIVDDQSEDGTPNLVNRYVALYPFIRLINSNPSLNHSFKKQALMQGIEASTGEIIILTDADCCCPHKWIESMVDNFIPEINAVCGPVYYKTNNLFQKILALELSGFILMTCGSLAIGYPFLANGANFAFRKATFDSVGGYSGNMDISSGDDVSLMLKIHRLFPGSIGFAKSRDCNIITNPPDGIKTFFNQRIRWAGKNSGYLPKINLYVSIGIFISYLSLFILPFIELRFAILIIMLRIVFEFTSLWVVNRFFGKLILLRYYLLLAIFYPFYIIFITLISSIKKKYNWKDRITQ